MENKFSIGQSVLIRGKIQSFTISDEGVEYTIKPEQSDKKWRMNVTTVPEEAVESPTGAINTGF